MKVARIRRERERYGDRRRKRKVTVRSMGSEEDKERLVGDREGAKKIERDGKKTTQDIVRE